MRSRFLPALSLLTPLSLLTLGLAVPAQAENVQHTQQLISTKACQRCDLSNAGLVSANLAGADVSGANLSSANLSNARLQGANLRGANLQGAVLFNANLTNADLRGVNLQKADLRGAVLTGAVWDGSNVDGANLLGAVGLPSQIATPENLYVIGLTEAQRGNFRDAITNYNQALTQKPDFAHAVLARGVARFRMGDRPGALEDAKKAQTLYLAQGNTQGETVSTQFVEGIQAIQQAEARGPRYGGDAASASPTSGGSTSGGHSGGNGSGGGFLGFLGSIAGMLLQFVPGMGGK
jgi:tetratricopeptide (TPR) repeat protein